MPLLRITALHKYYGDHHVLKGIDLSVEEGQVVAIIGRSGSGKSTLLRTLNGLESINDGVIEVDGEYLDAARADLRSLRQKVGMVFQQFNLFPHLTVGENVMLAPQVVQKCPRPRRPSWRGRCWNRSGWARNSMRSPTACPAANSNGWRLPAPWRCRRKCCCATKSLRPWTELVNEVLSVVRQLAKEGMTLIMVTHEMRFAREVGDKLVFMHQGKVHEVGDPRCCSPIRRLRSWRIYRDCRIGGVIFSWRIPARSARDPRSTPPREPGSRSPASRCRPPLARKTCAPGQAHRPAWQPMSGQATSGWPAPGSAHAPGTIRQPAHRREAV